MEEVKRIRGFEDIIGQERIVGHIKNAITSKKTSHAYIFSGEAGMGKKMMAKRFAMTLQCEKGGANPCMECHSCKQAISGNQPDIKWLVPEKTSTIGVDDIREQVVGDIVIKPYSSRYKIYIIDEAHKMNVQAQNALLKTIEEPPEYGIVILLTNNKETFLQTILSRCVMLEMKPVGNEQIVEYLKSVTKVPDYQAKMVVNFAGGNIGRAIRLASVGEFVKLKEMVLSHLDGLEGALTCDIQRYVKEISEYKDNISEYIDLLMAWFRDVLLYKASKDANCLIFAEKILLIDKFSNKMSYNAVNEIFMSLDKVQTRIKANVNFELTVELMLMAIRDELK